MRENCLAVAVDAKPFPQPQLRRNVCWVNPYPSLCVSVYDVLLFLLRQIKLNSKKLAIVSIKVSRTWEFYFHLWFARECHARRLNHAVKSQANCLIDNILQSPWGIKYHISSIALLSRAAVLLMESLARPFWDRDVSFVIQIEINYEPPFISRLINFLRTRARAINLRLVFRVDSAKSGRGGASVGKVVSIFAKLPRGKSKLFPITHRLGEQWVRSLNIIKL